MKGLNAIAIALYVGIMPVSSYAIVDVLQHRCSHLMTGGLKLTPSHTWSCSTEIGGIGMHSSTPVTQIEAIAKQGLPKVYAVNEVDALLKERDRSISQLRKYLEIKLGMVKAQVPRQISNEVEQVIKTNLRDVLRDLIASDQEFRKAITDIILNRK